MSEAVVWAFRLNAYNSFGPVSTSPTFSFVFNCLDLANIKEKKQRMSTVALAEWLRRVPAKYMGFPRESSNLSGDELHSFCYFVSNIFALLSACIFLLYFC